MEPDQSEWNAYYLRMRGRLIGRPLPGPDETAPAEVMEAYDACKRLVANDDLPVLFKFLEKRIAHEELNVKAETATNEQLRAMKAKRQTLEWFAAEIVAHIQAMDLAAEEQKKQTSDDTPNPIPTT